MYQEPLLSKKLHLSSVVSIIYLLTQISKVPHNAVGYCSVCIYSGCIIANLQNIVVSNKMSLLLWLI